MRCWHWGLCPRVSLPHLPAAGRVGWAYNRLWMSFLSFTIQKVLWHCSTEVLCERFPVYYAGTASDNSNCLKTAATAFLHSDSCQLRRYTQNRVESSLMLWCQGLFDLFRWGSDLQLATHILAYDLPYPLWSTQPQRNIPQGRTTRSPWATSLHPK